VLTRIAPIDPPLSLWFTRAGDWAARVNIVSCGYINHTQLARR
jgi:hypothetical protein